MGRILGQFKMTYGGSEKLYLFYPDNLGSRRVILDSTASVLDKYTYSPWGTYS